LSGGRSVATVADVSRETTTTNHPMKNNTKEILGSIVTLAGIAVIVWLMLSL
jgi:hypothetical protein